MGALASGFYTAVRLARPRASRFGFRVCTRYDVVPPRTIGYHWIGRLQRVTHTQHNSLPPPVSLFLSFFVHERAKKQQIFFLSFFGIGRVFCEAVYLHSFDQMMGDVPPVVGGGSGRSGTTTTILERLAAEKEEAGRRHVAASEDVHRRRQKLGMGARESDDTSDAQLCALEMIRRDAYCLHARAVSAHCR